MLRRLIRFCTLSLYAAGSIALVCAFVFHFSDTKNWFFIALLIIEVSGFSIGFVELYLLKRSRKPIVPSEVNQKTHVYVFIGDENIETVRISLLSINHLRGSPKVTISLNKHRPEIESLCSEFKFDYTCDALSFDPEIERYLFTNGHSIIYPDAILVAERSLSDSLSYVELNHSIYSAHALSNENVGRDGSRASMVAVAAGSYDIGVYTGGPILLKSDRINLNVIEKIGKPLTFAQAIGAGIANGLLGTITSHPCCECMSHNEIDHNISSRTQRTRVSRTLNKRPKSKKGTTARFRRLVAWYYMRLFWLKSFSYLAAGLTVIAALVLRVPNESFSRMLFGLFVLTQLCSYIASLSSSDTRRPLERLRDSILDCEAFLHALVLRFKAKSILSQYNLRFVPLFILGVLFAIITRFVSEPIASSITDESFLNSFFTLTSGALLLVVVYKSMDKYLSARQRAFARRNVSIPGSSSYESMWIVDLTHRGAAYISDTQFEVGDETPLVFRIPTMEEDALITVVGKVTYAARKDDKYHVGVVFKEISTQALDQLTLYCSVIYPFRQARYLDTSDYVVKAKAPSKKVGRTNLLSAAIYSCTSVVIVAMLISCIPTSKYKSSLESRGTGNVATRAKLKFGAGQYEIGSIKKDLRIDPVKITSSIYIDSNNNSLHDSNERGIADVTVRLFTSRNEEIPIGPDGILGTADDGSGYFITGTDGTINFAQLKSDHYFITLSGIPDTLTLSSSSLKKTLMVPSLFGYKSSIFNVDSASGTHIKDLNIGFVTKYDLSITQEFVDLSAIGVKPGERVKVRLTVSNVGENATRSGYVVKSSLGEDYSTNKISMLETTGFSPCGFLKNKLQCVGTSALSPGESKIIEFSLTSNVSSSSTSYRRLIKSWVSPSALEHRENNLIEALSNNSFESVLPVGKSTSIGSRVFFDANRNSIADSGEPGIEGIRVGLVAFDDINADGIKDPGETTEITHSTTDANGYFGSHSGKNGFQNLDTNLTYRLTFSKIPAQLSTSDVAIVSTSQEDGSKSGLLATQWVSLEKGAVNSSLDLALVSESRDLSSVVFIDKNSNKKFETNEVGLSGQEVRLYKWVDVDNDKVKDVHEVSSLPIAIGLSDSNGQFVFNAIGDSLAKTYYFVESDFPVGYGLWDSTNKQIKTTNKNRLTSPSATSDDFKNEARLRVKETGAIISGKIWADISRDAHYDENENGVAHIWVDLIGESGRIIARAKTNRFGVYEFKNVSIGNYTLGFEKRSLPKGFTLASINTRLISKGIVGDKTLPLIVETNSPIFLADLALLQSEKIAKVQIKAERTRSIAEKVRQLDISEVALSRVAHADLRTTATYLALFMGLSAIFTLIRRRKLIYRNT